MKTYKIECSDCGRFYQSDKRRAKSIAKRLATDPDYLKNYQCSLCRSGKKAQRVQVTVDVPSKGQVKAQMQVSDDVKQYIPKEPVKCVERYFGKGNGRLSVSSLLDKHYKSPNPMMKNVCFIGDTGTGKSLSVYNWAFKRKLPYYRYVVSAGTTGEDLIGQMVIDEDGKWKFHYQVLIKMMMHGGVFVFDEINAGQREIMHLLNSITDFERIAVVTQHKGEVVKASKDFLVVATMNPPKEYGLNTLSPSLKSRFTPYTFNYDARVDAKVLGKDEDKLVEFAKKVRLARDNGIIETPLSTRDLVMFKTVRDEIGYEIAKEMMLSKFHNDEQSEVRTQVEVFLEQPNAKVNT
jgi:hypothetical protein